MRCIVLYCIMRPYTDGRLDRYRIGIPRELSEIRTQPWLSAGLGSSTVDQVLKYPKYIPSTSTGQVLIFLKST